MDFDYRGARFLKCDLQVQTPADRARWLGRPLACDADGARRFVEACLSVGLEAIGVTDHNFASKHFLPELQAAAKALAAESGSDPLVIFPGFEIQANVGKGLHVLALFEPDVDLDAVDHILTECGIPGPNRFLDGAPIPSTKGLREIIAAVQKRPSGPRGIVICPHAQAEAGIFDNERISEWLQADEFSNPDLLCLELPKAPSAMSRGWQRLLENGEDCEARWRRPRPIAVILSSDAKALAADDCEKGTVHTGNFLGFRHSWIKMSEPSVEALRLAFLDPGGRIRLDTSDPALALSHPYVSQVAITGSDFLEDLDLVLSPGLNVVIGGRGTGKSTLLDILSDAMGARSGRGVKRIASGGRLEALARMGALEKSGLWDDPGRSDPPPDFAHMAGLLSARAVGQGELARLAEEHPDFLTNLIDEFIGSPLLTAKERTRDALARVSALASLAARIPDLAERARDLGTKRTRLESELAATTRAAELTAAFQSRRDQIAPVEQLLSEMDQLLATARELTCDLVASSDGEGAIAELQSAGVAAVHEFLASSRSAADKLLRERMRIDAAPELTELRVGVREAQTKLREQSGGSGTSDDLEQKVAALEETGRRLEDCDRDRQVADDALNALLGAGEEVRELLSAYSSESELRERACAELTGRMPTTRSGTPVVELTLERSGDPGPLLDAIRSWPRDGRRLSDRDLESVVGWMRDVAARQHVTYLAVASDLEARLAAADAPTDLPRLSDSATAALQELLSLENRVRLATVPTSDFVRAKLRRLDGTEVGELGSGTLSLGQRVTVALAVLLNVGNGPLIIDQPEEDLDGAFVFQELVPLVRKTREQRQLIFATHNPNIPVGGDADLILPFEVGIGSDGLPVGQLARERGADTACGALDRTVTKNAVEATLEGSSAAFQRRAEAYGY